MHNYITFKIPKKSGGYREISAPVPELKQKQKEILNKLYENGVLELVSCYAYGFLPGRSIYDNARVHAGKKFILNVDIKDFFPSCRRVGAWHISMLKNALDKEEINLLFYNDSLPQGAPTSPLVSNFYLAKFDRILPVVLKKRVSDDIRYSRYADDITISSNSKVIFSKLCIKIISEILKQFDFKINYKKVRFMTLSSRQEITGLVVNSGKPTVSKKIRKNLKAAVHNIITGKVIPTKTELNRIKGHLAFCMQIPEHRQWAGELLKKLGVNVKSKLIQQKNSIEDTFKKKIEAYAKGEVSTLPFSIDELSLAKIIFRSKNVPYEKKLPYAFTLFRHSFDWLLNKLCKDKKLAEQFIIYVMENTNNLPEKYLQEVIRAVMKKLSSYKRAYLLVAYPKLKNYIKKN